MGLDQVEHFQPGEITVICTGSQGEPLSALSLIASGEHKQIRLRASDTVILSASPIPGNESAVHRVLNELYKAGADVYHSGIARVHVSGHAASEEIQEIASLIGPRHLVPVHGEYRQLATHRRLAEAAGLSSDQITIVEDGDTLQLKGGVVSRGERVHAGMVLVDGLGVGDVGPVVLRDRKHLAEDGILVCVVTIDGQSGELLAGPDLISRGFVHIDESASCSRTRPTRSRTHSRSSRPSTSPTGARSRRPVADPWASSCGAKPAAARSSSR